METSGSRACVGLDPRPDMIPESLQRVALDAHGDTAEAVAAAFTEFNAGIIEAIAGACAAVKPQVACYEAYGAAGWQCLLDTMAMARDAGIPVIADGKRGDLGSSAIHYRESFFGGAPGFGDKPVTGGDAQWLTVHAYLGSDSVLTILDDPAEERGVFVLVKTSNPSSGELQDINLADGEARGTNVADTVAALVHEWGSARLGQCGLSDVGAVVGATYPDDARRLRKKMPNTLFLVPGYGAQGASAADALAGARSDGSGVLVSSSRGITAAWTKTDTDDFAGSARQALDAMNADLSQG